MTTPATAQPATVLRCSTPADLLRLVPHLVDVPTDDSLVLVLWRGTRTHGALRVDLPTTRLPHEQRAWAARVLGTACKVDGVEGVLPVVYTGDAFAPSGRLPHADLLRAIKREAGRMGLEVRDLLCVAADGWGSLMDPRLPRGGGPLADLEPRDGDPAPRPARAVPQYAEASEAQQDRFADALEQWWTRPEGPGGVLHGVDLRRSGSAFGPAAAGRAAMERYRWGEDSPDVVALIEGMLDPHDDRGGPCACRALLYALASRQGLENLVLAQLGWGRELGERLWRAAHDGDADDPVLVDLTTIMGGGPHRRPDVDRVERAIAVLVEVGGLVPPGLRAPVDGMLAWLHWALGAGSVGGALAERALADDPGRDVPALVLSRTRQGMLPEWAYREDPVGADPLAGLG